MLKQSHVLEGEAEKGRRRFLTRNWCLSDSFLFLMEGGEVIGYRTSGFFIHWMLSRKKTDERKELDVEERGRERSERNHHVESLVR